MLIFDKSDQVSNMAFPQKDMFGFCNNFKAPGFMQDKTNEGCLQTITDSVKTNPKKTFVDADYYIKKFQSAQEKRGTNELVDYEVGTVFVMDKNGQIS